MSGQRGEINGWRCDTCERHTYCVHVDDGVTPMFLACRASGNVNDCPGRGVSLMYPAGPAPQHILDAVLFEWYIPSAGKLRRLERKHPGIRDHVERGGLDLRPLSNAGRDVLRRFHDPSRDAA